jgi:hypothetical protein
MAPKRSSAGSSIENITLIGARGVTPLFFQLHAAVLWSNQDLITGNMEHMEKWMVAIIQGYRYLG